MLIRVRLLLGTLATIIFAVVSAQAQKPTLTKSVDEPGRSPYSQTAVTACPGGDCTVVFPAVPTGFRLVVTHVSVSYSAADSLPSPAMLTQSLGTNLYEYLPALSAGRNLRFTASGTVTYFVEPGSAPQIIVNDGLQGFLASGSINGYLVAIP